MTLQLKFAPLALAAALLLAAGCSKEPAPAPVATPAPVDTSASTAADAPAATPAPAETPVADAATSKADATLEALTQLPAQDQLPGGKWQAGRNYQPIVPAQPTSAPAGKVEVVEVFWYGCSHCYALDPFLENWQKSSKPGFVEFVRVPVMWGPAHKAHARLYYTLEALGREKDLHTKVFDTIQKGGNGLLGNDDAATASIQAKWAAAQGINEDEFMRTYNSFGVNSSLQRAEQLMRRYNVLGVPLMVVNGKYNTDVAMAGGHTQLISLLNDLASSEKRR